MPTPAKGARLGGSPAHEKIILANLASQLFEHGRIVTTETKAKRLRPLAERLITKAKRGDIHARRQVLTTVRDKGVVHVLFTEIAPNLEGRHGGYTRITKVGPRKGDNAPMAMIEIVTESVEDSRKSKSRGAAPARATSRPAAVPAATTEPGQALAGASAAETGTSAAEPASAIPAEAQDAAPDDTSTEQPAVVEKAAVEEAAVEELAVHEESGEPSQPS